MELNSTIWIQIGIFLYVVLMLRSLVFAPLLKILAKRDEITVGRVDAAAEMQKEIGEMRAKVDAEIQSLRSSLEERRHDTIRRNREISEKKIQEAKERVEKQILEKRGSLIQEQESVRSKIPGMAESVSQEIIKALSSSRVVRQ